MQVDADAVAEDSDKEFDVSLVEADVQELFEQSDGDDENVAESDEDSDDSTVDKDWADYDVEDAEVEDDDVTNAGASVCVPGYKSPHQEAKSRKED